MTRSTSIAERLGQFVADTSLDDLPAEVVAHAKRCLLDFVGVALAGAATEGTRIMAGVVRAWGGNEQASVIGYPFRLPCPSAGLLNAAMGHAIQMDDTSSLSIAHIGTSAIPAALAVGEARRVSGGQFLLAFVLGYEAGMRIGESINPSHNWRGFSPNGTVGVFGAAIAAAKALGLDAKQTADALGSAGVQASGLEQFVLDGSLGSVLITGHAAQAGIVSALLAEQGFDGSPYILEGRKGFCRAYSDEYDAENIAAGLGERYRLMEVWFKKYPTCADANPVLDGVLALMRDQRLAEDDVQEVLVRTYAIVDNTINNPEPHNRTAAMLSLQYCVAVALLDGEVTLRQFADDRLDDERVRSTMRKVRMLVSEEELLSLQPGLGLGSIVAIICHDGRRFEQRVVAPKGHTLNPFSEQELMDKYLLLSQMRVDADTARAIAEMICRLDELPDMRELAQLLCCPEG